ncbi:hypothetical protein COV18_04080 [Candidatus Woesearchaeota archaeon CG10_big_fil_rev_8_21_14_0_10_37_12]|nr:MAG: hypothetical protein COV18_04080 [Candidatus Woesearchaeota archaeon CG10_big_fil_rev_8_21_14_0_10_37_12]
MGKEYISLLLSLQTEGRWQKMKKTIFIVLTIIFLAACVQEQTIDTIKIGYIGPLTGTGSPYGIAELNAARLAVGDSNSDGGINGKQVELVAEDGKCEGAAATTAANKLISVDKVNYILGGHCSTESLSIVPITEANHVFLMAGATGANDFTNSGKYAFRTYPPAKVLYGRLADYAYKKGTRTVVTLNEEKDWPQSVVESFKIRFTELGGKVLLSETYAPGTADFKTQLLKLAELNPDAVMISVQGPDSAAQIIKQMNELNIDLQIYGDTLIVSTGVYDRTNGLLPESAVGSTPHVDPDKSPETKAFYERYLSLHKDPGIDPFVVMEGFDGANIVLSLIKECSDDVDCARSKLLNSNWSGVAGTFKFGEDGNPETKFVAIVSIIDGKQVFLEE